MIHVAALLCMRYLNGFLYFGSVSVYVQAQKLLVVFNVGYFVLYRIQFCKMQAWNEIYIFVLSGVFRLWITIEVLRFIRNGQVLK
jgi:hypothetical protein